MADFTDVALVSAADFDITDTFTLSDISFPSDDRTDVELVASSFFDALPADNFFWTDISLPPVDWIDIVLQSFSDEIGGSTFRYTNRVFNFVLGIDIYWKSTVLPDLNGTAFPGPGDFSTDTTQQVFVSFTEVVP